MKRRMAAIMVGDIVGFSALMEKSEERTIARLAACEALIAEKVAALDGRIFNRAGDATLAEFPSPINALRCAVEIGVELAGAGGAADEPLRMRFGVHLADVAVHGDNLLGDGVNLTARLQQGAAPGAIWISGTLFEQNSPQFAVYVRRPWRAPLEESVRTDPNLSGSRRNRRSPPSIRPDSPDEQPSEATFVRGDHAVSSPGRG